jgi:tetratricopeptide (TPR) repeat protein
MPASWVAAALSRVLGLAALGAAVLFARLPDEARQAELLLHTGRFAEAQAAADRALVRAPLDWRVYFTRAGARACRGQTLEALADFRRARTLEPHYAGLPLDEGRFWLQSQPALALTVWREALRRVHSPEEEEIYGQMLTAAPDNAGFRAQLLALAENRPVLQVQWFRFVPPAEARPQFNKISADAQRCTPAQRAAFQRWAEEIGASPPP